MSENYNFNEEIFKQEMNEMQEQTTENLDPQILNEVKNGIENTFKQQETEEERKFKNEVKQVKRFSEKIIKNVVQDIVF